MAENDVRPLRICDLCGQVDDHPRHVVAHAPGSVPVNQPLVAQIKGTRGLSPEVKAAVIADIEDTSLELRHMDCCAQAGCPDGSCVAIRKVGNASKLKGMELVGFLTSGKVDGVGEKITERAAKAAESQEG